MTEKHSIKRWLPPLLIILAGVLAYWNSFDGVFLYDDLDSIRDNEHIRQLCPLSEAMSVPLWSSATTVDCRPLLSLSFALNHAIFGPEPWGYHLVNLLIHIMAGLLLFGIVRRTLNLPRFCERYGQRGTWVALVAALIWLVHPLQTESVTYMVQRAESLMGMFFLMTLYCAIRGMTRYGIRDAGCVERGFQVPSSEFKVEGREKSSASAAKATGDGDVAMPAEGVDDKATESFRFSARGGSAFGGQVSGPAQRGINFRLATPTAWFSQRAWLIMAVIACALGMGVKQTMFAAPLLVLLYDWVFVSESLRSALSKRKWFYGALCATWLIVFGIIGATWKESTIDFVKISPWRYLATQPLVMLKYLQLSVWPSPLVLTYGWVLEEQWYRIVFPGLAILGLLAVMFRGLWHRKWYGFLLAWFFLILAPTSSIAPTRQAIVEHRMYLSLAAVILFAVLGTEDILGRLNMPSRRRSLLGRWLAGAVLLTLGCLTHIRNADYHSELGMWQANVLDRPQDPVSHLNLGNSLQGLGRGDEAVACYREALRLEPGYAEAHYNWGVALKNQGQLQEAVTHYREALRRKPDHLGALNNLGHALHAMGRSREAVEYCREALRIKPNLVEVHFNLGNALQGIGRSEEAIAHYREALRIKPDRAEAYIGWGNVLLASGGLQEAVTKYQEALRIKPEDAKAQYHWGMALEGLGRPQEAISHYREAIRVNPGFAEAHLNLGNAELALGRPREAMTHYQQALRVRPGYLQAQQNLSIALRRLEEGK